MTLMAKADSGEIMVQGMIATALVGSLAVGGAAAASATAFLADKLSMPIKNALRPGVRLSRSHRGPPAGTP